MANVEDRFIEAVIFLCLIALALSLPANIVALLNAQSESQACQMFLLTGLTLPIGLASGGFVLSCLREAWVNR